MNNIHNELILILDFGSQYTQLIARRVREQGVYSEIKPFDYPVEKIRELAPNGIILSGGPSSVYSQDAPIISKNIFDLGIPILGICYGLQLISYLCEGEITHADQREYGHALLTIPGTDPMLKNIKSPLKVWMSHGDRLVNLPPDFTVLGYTSNSPYALIKHQTQKIYGLQFHPEVAHTEQGSQIISNFIFNVAGCKGDWTPQSFIKSSIRKILKFENPLVNPDRLFV